MNNSLFLPIILLATSEGEVRRRSQNSVLLSAIPGNESMRGAVTAIAVTQQAKQSLADETAAVIAAAELIKDTRAGGGEITLELLQDDQVLNRIASEDVVKALQAAVAARSPADEAQTVIAAADLIAAHRAGAAETPIEQEELKLKLPLIAGKAGVRDALNEAVFAPDDPPQLGPGPASPASSPPAVAASKREPDGKRKSSTSVAAGVT